MSAEANLTKAVQFMYESVDAALTTMGSYLKAKMNPEKIFKKEINSNKQQNEK